MKNLVFLSLGLLVSVASMGAMQQPYFNYTGPVKVKALSGTMTAKYAVLANGQRVTLDPSITWTIDQSSNLVPFHIPKQAAPQVAAPKAPVSAPTKAAAVQSVPQAAAARVVVRGGRCPGSACPAKPVVIKQGGRCTTCPKQNIRVIGKRVGAQAATAVAAPQVAAAPQAAAVQAAPKGPITYNMPGGTVTINGPHYAHHKRHFKLEVTKK